MLAIKGATKFQPGKRLRTLVGTPRVRFGRTKLCKYYRPNFRRATRDNNQVSYKPRKCFTNINRRFSSRHSAARHDVSTCKTGGNSIDDAHMESSIFNSHGRLDDSFSESLVSDIVVISGPPYPAKIAYLKQYEEYLCPVSSATKNSNHIVVFDNRDNPVTKYSTYETQ